MFGWTLMALTALGSDLTRMTAPSERTLSKSASKGLFQRSTHYTLLATAARWMPMAQTLPALTALTALQGDRLPSI